MSFEEKDVKIFFNKFYDNFLDEMKRTFEFDLTKDENIDVETKIDYFSCIDDDVFLKIQEKNEEIFENDFFISKEINLKSIWTNEKNNENNKTAIWKYLNTLVFMARTMTQGKCDDNELNKVTELFANKEISEDETCEELVDGSFDISENENIPDYLKNTKIGKLASDIVKDLDFNSIDLDEFKNMENPDIGSIISKLFSGENSNIGNMVKTVGESIQEKMRDVNKDELLGEMETIVGNMKDDPLMGSILGSMKDMNLGEGGGPGNLQGVMGEVMKNMTGLSGNKKDDDDFEVLESMFQGQNVESGSNVEGGSVGTDEEEQAKKMLENLGSLGGGNFNDLLKLTKQLQESLGGNNGPGELPDLDNLLNMAKNVQKNGQNIQRSGSNSTDARKEKLRKKLREKANKKSLVKK